MVRENRAGTFHYHVTNKLFSPAIPKPNRSSSGTRASSCHHLDHQPVHLRLRDEPRTSAVVWRELEKSGLNPPKKRGCELPVHKCRREPTKYTQNIANPNITTTESLLQPLTQHPTDKQAAHPPPESHPSSSNPNQRTASSTLPRSPAQPTTTSSSAASPAPSHSHPRSPAASPYKQSSHATRAH
jgi:hypothetical protein